MVHLHFAARWVEAALLWEPSARSASRSENRKMRATMDGTAIG
jgi:hypothetical protein